MAFEAIPFVLTIVLVILALLVIRFVIKAAFTLLKIGIIVLFAVGIYFLFTTFIG
jgi:hypothetical protein